MRRGRNASDASQIPGFGCRNNMRKLFALADFNRIASAVSHRGGWMEEGPRNPRKFVPVGVRD
jgi:hypothetical protein